jgi:hypothetical protein
VELGVKRVGVAGASRAGMRELRLGRGATTLETLAGF